MTDHSNVNTDLTIEEVVALPVSPDIDATKLYFRTSDQLYFRPARPDGQSGDGAQATFDFPAGNNSARGLRITLARTLTAGDQGNGTVFVSREGAANAVTLDDKSTPKDVTIEYASNATMGQLKTLIDAVTGLSSTYYNSGVAGDTPSETTGEFEGGTPDYDLIPLVIASGHVYARTDMSRITGAGKVDVRGQQLATFTMPSSVTAAGQLLSSNTNQYALTADATAIGYRLVSQGGQGRFVSPALSADGMENVVGYWFESFSGNTFVGRQIIPFTRRPRSVSATTSSALSGGDAHTHTVSIPLDTGFMHVDTSVARVFADLSAFVDGTFVLTWWSFSGATSSAEWNRIEGKTIRIYEWL